VTSHQLRRWLVGAVLVVAFASIGVGRDVAASSLVRNAGAAAGTAHSPGVESSDAVVPPRAAKLSVAERAGAKLPGLSVILAAVAAAAVAAPRVRRHGHGAVSLPPALRQPAVRRRGPPLLSLA
jgi:hypothetical protein